MTATATRKTTSLGLGTLASSEAINAFRALERYVLREGMTGFSVTYYGTREQLETALFEGRIDVAWNRPLDHVRAILRSEGTADDELPERIFGAGRFPCADYLQIPFFGA